MCFSFSDQVNKKTLVDIQESIFVLNLDEAMPATVGVDERYCTMAGQMLHGGGSQLNTSNRWFDKTLQVRNNRHMSSLSTYSQRKSKQRTLT